MALARGRSSLKCGAITLHTETAIHIAKQMTRVSKHGSESFIFLPYRIFHTRRVSQLAVRRLDPGESPGSSLTRAISKPISQGGYRLTDPLVYWTLALCVGGGVCACACACMRVCACTRMLIQSDRLIPSSRLPIHVISV